MKKNFAIIPLLMMMCLSSFAQTYNNMALIHSKNQSFMMGWTKEEAGTEWACFIGKHKVTFTYNLYMDSTLVTQKDYMELMGINPSAHQTGNLKLPVEKVSWYDAVLYCNARSKRDKLDTVYAYTSIIKKDTSVSGLAGLEYDIHKNGYRLPTNAEYEFTERNGNKGTYFFADTLQNIDSLGNLYAWSKFNSDFLTHEVALKKAHALGLYDIIGNVFEWCSDWEGPYSAEAQTDPVDVADGKTECGTRWIGSEKKMAKGGSYRTDIFGHMRINYHYKWPPATASPEIGFRCVATKK
ncbi:MAG: SUMF1/EgtB/PvdO family nonheme iron enzyme [Ferruginibacter sp.]|nr:SUMF1/EgtB/PvdO family nonheme iron enzyme [Ferruginibacter sp.]